MGSCACCDDEGVVMYALFLLSLHSDDLCFLVECDRGTENEGEG